MGLLLTMSTLSPVSAIRAAEPPNVLLSEIAWAGSEKSTADEWIELRNLGSGSVDVSGWSLTGVGTSGSIITLPPATSIPSGSTYLIANYANTNEKTTLVVTPNLVTTAVSIPNTGLNVTLLDSAGATIDSLLDPGVPNFGSSSTFSTMKRDLASLAWLTETASNNVSHVSVIADVTEAPVAPSSPTTTTIAESPVVPSSPMINGIAEVVAVEIIVTEVPTTLSIPGVTSDTSAPVAIPITEIPIVLDPVVLSAPVTNSTTTDITLTESSSVILPGDIAITSILSAPSTGNDEIVVLTNTTDHSIALESLTLVDASGKITELSGTIAAGTTQQILNPNGNLNNDGDSVAVMNADVIIDEVIYGTDDIPAPKKDASLVNIDGIWTMEITSSPVLESTPDVPASESILTTDIPASSAVASTALIEPVVPIVNTAPVVIPIVKEAVATSAVSATAPTPTDATSTTTTLHVGDIVIHEILSSPSTGFDEWVELKNTTSAPLLLDGLVLVDASGNETLLSGTIAAQGYSTIINPNGKLNNDEDSVLLMSNAVVIDSVSYGTVELPAPKKDTALALIDGVWIAQQSTPARANTTTLIPTLSPTLYADTATLVAAEQAAITANSSSSPRSSGGSTARKNNVASATQRVTTADSIVASAARVSTASTAPTVKTAAVSSKKTSAKRVVVTRSISADEIANIADGTRVSLDGVVIASTGILGKRSFFIDGLEIYQSTGTLADVAVGDRVRIVGAVSVLSDHRRVNIQEGGVTHLGISTPIVHDYAASLSYGSLMRITGTVSARDGNAVLLKTDEATFKVVPGTGVSIAWADFAGATVTVTGILKHSEQETLVLRSADDVVTISVPDSTATLAGTSAAASTSSSSETSFLWETAALLAFASAGFGTWVWYTRPKAKTSKLTLHAQNV